MSNEFLYKYDKKSLTENKREFKMNVIEKLNVALFEHDLAKMKILDSFKDEIERKLMRAVLDLDMSMGFAWEQFCFEDNGENYFMIENVWIFDLDRNEEIYQLSTYHLNKLEEFTKYINSIPSLFLEHTYKSPCQVYVYEDKIVIKPI